MTGKMTGKLTGNLARLLLALTLAIPAVAQDKPPAAVLTYHFEHPALPVPIFTLTLHEDGTATYAATYAPPPQNPNRYAGSYVAQAAASAPASVTRAITLSPTTTALLFERVRSTNRFHGGCETTQKNIANSGAKTITYTDAAGEARCTFNYSDSKTILAVSETFQAVAHTLDVGRTLEMNHRYDRLGLDKEMAQLLDAIHDGQALEIATIAPVLRSIADDPQVLERVRKRAVGLLDSTSH